MRTTTLVAVSLLALCAATAARGQEVPGELRCSVAGGIGFAVVGDRAANCVYYRRDGRVEFYIGSLGRLGLDLGPAQARQVAFIVTVRQPEPKGALEGTFVGAGFGATLGRGVAADALVGGRDQTVAIVPIANSRPTGLNIEAGVGALNLRYAGTERRRAPIPGDATIDPNF